MAIKFAVSEEDYPTYEQLPEGNYLVSLTEQEDENTLIVYNKKDEFGDPTNTPDLQFASWRITVMEPAEHAGRVIFWKTFLWASKERLDRSPGWKPIEATLRFLLPIGAAEKVNLPSGGTQLRFAKSVLDKAGKLDFSKLPFGKPFWISYRDKMGKDGILRREIVKVWAADESVIREEPF